MASHPDMQKIHIIGYFFENRLHWQFGVENNFYKWLFRLHFYLHTKHSYINSLYAIDNWMENLSHNKMQDNYSDKMFT
jgi:hypothetical protein